MDTTIKLFQLAGERDFITTNEAAHVLNRKEQTLRKWACLQIGPVLPVRIFRRLAWPVESIAKTLRGEQ